MRDKKLQVFVSSTYLDLKEERQAAVEAILKAGHFPAGMELFTAGDQSQWDVIKRWIDESDVYILILGGRYGSINSQTGKSYTQMEFEYALEISKPLFSIVLSETFIDLKVNLDGKQVLELENTLKFREFKEKVQSNLVEFCDDVKDIKLSIITTLSELSYRKELMGWVRGDNLVNTGLVAEQIAKLSEENNFLRSQISNNKGETIPLYNGLTYIELKSLLLHETVTDVEDNIKNLFDFFMTLGPKRSPVRVEFIRFGSRANHKHFDRAMKRLADFGMIVFSVNPEYISTPPDSHNFHIRSNIEGKFKTLGDN